VITYSICGSCVRLFSMAVTLADAAALDLTGGSRRRQTENA
jgi:hypothetical protein